MHRYHAFTVLLSMWAIMHPVTCKPNFGYKGMVQSPYAPHYPYSSDVFVERSIVDALEHFLIQSGWIVGVDEGGECLAAENDGCVVELPFEVLSGSMTRVQYQYDPVQERVLRGRVRQADGSVTEQDVDLAFVSEISIRWKEDKSIHTLQLIQDVEKTIFVIGHFRSPSTAPQNMHETNSNEWDDVRIVSYNIWNVNGQWTKRTNLMCGALHAAFEEPIDIVGFQEVRYDFMHEAKHTFNPMKEKYPFLPSRFQHDDLLNHVVRGCQSQEMPRSKVNDNTRWLHWWRPAMTYLERQWHVDEGLSYFFNANYWDVVEKGETMVPRDLYDPLDEHQRKILWATVRRRGSCGACDHEKSSRAQCCTQITVFNTHWPLGSVARKRAAEMVWELATSLPLPQLLMGDLNAEPDDAALLWLTKGAGEEAKTHPFRDAWEEAAVVSPDWTEERQRGYTFFAWNLEKRIDYFLLRGEVKVKTAHRLAAGWSEGDGEPREREEEECASDHLGMALHLRIPRVHIPEEEC